MSLLKSFYFDNTNGHFNFIYYLSNFVYFICKSIDKYDFNVAYFAAAISVSVY